MIYDFCQLWKWSIISYNSEILTTTKLDAPNVNPIKWWDCITIKNVKTYILCISLDIIVTSIFLFQAVVSVWDNHFSFYNIYIVCNFLINIDFWNCLSWFQYICIFLHSQWESFELTPIVRAICKSRTNGSIPILQFGNRGTDCWKSDLKNRTILSSRTASTSCSQINSSLKYMLSQSAR